MKLKKLLKSAISTAVTAAMAFSIVPSAVTAAENETIDIGDYIQLGKYEDEPILWRVVDIDAQNGPLVMSDSILAMREYDAAGTGGSHANESKRGTGGSPVWSDSDLRAWLNSEAAAGDVVYPYENKPSYAEEKGFLNNDNFSEQEKNLMKEVTQISLVHTYDSSLPGYTTGSNFTVNEDNTWKDDLSSNYDSCAFQNVTDKMFIIDSKQAEKIKTNLSAEYLIGKYEGSAKFTWLRQSAGTYGSWAGILWSSMTPDSGLGAVWHNDAAKTNTGVRPAFYLNSEAATINSGTGSSDDPYILYSPWEIKSVLKNGNSVIVDVQNDTAEKPPVLMIGLYDENNVLIQSMLKDVGEKSAEYVFDVTGIEGVAYIKAFLFKDTKNIEPLAQSKTIKADAIQVDANFYPGWTRKAVTFSFDDGRVEDEKLIEILNSAGLKATFNFFQNKYTYADLPEKEDGTKDYSALLAIYEGHEIANHTLNHVPLMKPLEDKYEGTYEELTDEQAIAQLADGKAWLESIPEIAESDSQGSQKGKVRGFAWPLYNPDRQALTDYVNSEESGIAYARDVKTTSSFELPEDFKDWRCTIHHNALPTCGAKFMDLEDDGELKLLSVWGHAYEFQNGEDAGDTNKDWSVIENFADLVNKRTDVKLWKATNIDVVDYINAVRGLEIGDTYVKNDSDVTVYIKVNGENVTVPAHGMYQRNEQPTIYIAGDSIAASYPADQYPLTGWGQVLDKFFAEGSVEIKNRAVPGKSTKTFINEGKLDAIMNDIKLGDYLFVMFGTNDGMKSDSNRYTTPEEYRENLKIFVNSAREKGAIPVLVTSPVINKYDENGTFTGAGSVGQYPIVMREVAEELNVPLADLNTKTAEMAAALGKEEMSAIYMEDTVHFKYYGAQILAKIIVEDLKKYEIGLKYDVIEFIPEQNWE